MTSPPGVDPRDPQAIRELAWRNDSVQRTFAARYLHTFGLRAVALRREDRLAEVDGMMVLEGGIFAFDIAEEAGSDLDETVEFILVVDPAVGRLLVGWDANISAENAISVEVPYEHQPWVTVEIPSNAQDSPGGARAEPTSSWLPRDANTRRAPRALTRCGSATLA